MSQVKTKEEYRQEYLNICTELGNVEYIIAQKEKEAELLVTKLEQVNLSYTVVDDASAPAAVPVVEAPSVQPQS